MGFIGLDIYGWKWEFPYEYIRHQLQKSQSVDMSLNKIGIGMLQTGKIHILFPSYV
jgi:hypothetical protein